jgi:hypothetical protein
MTCGEGRVVLQNGVKTVHGVCGVAEISVNDLIKAMHRVVAVTRVVKSEMILYLHKPVRKIAVCEPKKGALPLWKVDPGSDFDEGNDRIAPRLKRGLEMSARSHQAVLAKEARLAR